MSCHVMLAASKHFDHMEARSKFDRLMANHGEELAWASGNVIYVTYYGSGAVGVK